MKRLITFQVLFVLLTFRLSGVGFATAQVATQVDIPIVFTKSHLKLIKKQLKDLPVGTELSIVIVTDSVSYYLGVRKGEKKVSYVNNHEKAFEIGSITKVFTSTILSHYISIDSLNQNALINPYFNFQFKDETEISFLSLSNHTSGLPRLPNSFSPANPLDPYLTYNTDDFDAYLRLDVVVKDSLSNYAYSNIGAALLGYSLTKVGSASYDELLNDIILKPLKMNNTVVNREKLNVALVQGLDANGAAFAGWNFDAYAPAGAILSTTSDLSKFLLGHFYGSNKAFILSRKETINISEDLSVGYGWHILKNKGVDKLYWHNGGTGGYTSSMAMDLQSKNGIVILSNVSAFSENSYLIDDLNFKLFELFRNN
ncbi:serine hydrolase domain-containing protein [Crocinitomix catalasitica]|uniref:serine hydrolase domain-containing protein n=1 Tax=Crocinitomix catalasitica TaxID=184607 RepID=UPI000485A0F7|nr:serine hydrolase [Crocinitomix catalasitica]